MENIENVENAEKEIPKINRGYKIIYEYRVGKVTHAIGHDPKSPDPYVAWYYTPESGFYWGSRYTSTYEKAMTCLLDRVRMADVNSLKARDVIPSDKGGRDVR